MTMMAGSDGLTDQPLGAKRKRAIILRTGCFFLAMVALLAASRSGTGLPTVATVLTVYVATAVLWVRGQYATSIAPDQTIWTPPYRLSAPLTVISLIVVVVGLATDSGTTFIAGLAAAYFCAGYLVMRVRVEARKSTRFWCAWLGACALAVAIGLTLPSSRPALLVAGLGAVLTPIGLGVLAGRAITALAADSPARWWRRSWSGRQVAAIGALAVAVGAALALSRVGNLFMVVGLVCLGLAVVGLVSNTYADIAAVILVVALLGITPHHETFPKDLVPAEGDANVLVALGDSYMSGEGADIYYEGTDVGGENQCHRSPTSWAVRPGSGPLRRAGVPRLLRRAHLQRAARRQPDDRDPEPRRTSTTSPAPSSTSTPTRGRAGFTPRPRGDQSRRQRRRLLHDRPGVCLAPGAATPGHARLVHRRAPRSRRSWPSTFAEVREVFGHPGRRGGLPRPDLQPDGRGDGRGCAAPGLQQRGALDGGPQFVEEFLEDLDATVEAAARGVEGFTYLAEMATSLEGANLQLCDPGNENRPGLNFIGLRSVDGIAEQRFHPKNWYHNSLHPNERGHAAMLQTFETWLATEVSDVDTSDPRDEDGPPTCELYQEQDGTPTCDAEAGAWIGGEARWALTLGGWGLALLLVAAGAWLLAVAFYAWRLRLAADEEDDPGVGAGWIESLLGTWRRSPT